MVVEAFEVKIKKKVGMRSRVDADLTSAGKSSFQSLPPRIEDFISTISITARDIHNKSQRHHAVFTLYEPSRHNNEDDPTSYTFCEDSTAIKNNPASS